MHPIAEFSMKELRAVFDGAISCFPGIEATRHTDNFPETHFRGALGGEG
jgi:hypothetical protein